MTPSGGSPGRIPRVPALPGTSRSEVREPSVVKKVVPRVIAYECCLGDGPPLHELLESEGYDLVAFREGEGLLEAAVERPADVVVYEFDPDRQGELGQLQLLRRVAPAVPLILLSCRGSLELQRLLQALRPAYYAIRPLDTDELREAVRSVLERRRSRAG